MSKWVEQRAPLEDLAEQDLRKAGLEVARVAGAFPNLNQSGLDAVNFLNCLYFLDSAETDETLRLQVGLKCCTKVVGEVAVPVSLKQNLTKTEPDSQPALWDF